MSAIFIHAIANRLIKIGEYIPLTQRLKQRLQQRWRAGLVLLACLLLSGCPTTVPFVDINRYTGLWYEIASYPTFFNEDLVGTTAEYSLLEDGNLGIVNRAFVGSFDGPETSIEGFAKPLDDSNARLIVTFDMPFGRILKGFYWIIGLDEDYQYAVVSDPAMETLFILSRTPQMDEALYQEILLSLTAAGYDISLLNRTPQLPE